MPFYLSGFSGGLGNQIFSIVTVYSLSKKYNTTFSINRGQTTVKSIGDFSIPVYINSTFTSFLETSNYRENTDITTIVVVNLPQFTDFTIQNTINPENTSIQLEGLPMKYSIFKEYIDEISELFYRQKKLYIPYTLPKMQIKRRVGIMFRTFMQESSQQWMVKDEYYMNAIQYLLSKHGRNYEYEFHIYSDVEHIGSSIIKTVCNKLTIYPIIYEFVGLRDNTTDVKHFFQMFDLDDYILCNSTYHYWPALLSTYRSNKIVTFPSITQDGNNINWFKHIAPESWVQL